MRLMRELRLIPVVAIAAAALFVLKTSALLIEGGYTLLASRTAQAQGLGTQPNTVELPPPAALEASSPSVPARGAKADNSAASGVHSWVRDLYSPQSRNEDITGSVAAPPKPAEPAKDTPPPAPPENAKPQMSAGERAVLESLQQRRQELETRAREIEVRDSLLRAAEKRIEQKLQELKDSETRATGVAAEKKEAEAAKFKSLVTMYENMKAKDAARIFDRLDLRVLIEVADAMNPRRMSDILGLMDPAAAEKLTVELANRSGQMGKASAPQQPAAELPKIEGRPRS
jgi:flagellar motility protein MotE (MotC chaperone)